MLIVNGPCPWSSSLLFKEKNKQERINQFSCLKIKTGVRAPFDVPGKIARRKNVWEQQTKTKNASGWTATFSSSSLPLHLPIHPEYPRTICPIPQSQ
jgi:hypothetical protein